MNSVMRIFISNLICLLSICTAVTYSYGQADLLWAKQFGSESVEFPSVMCTDDDGNIYVAGGFSESITFGSITLTSNGVINIFILKLSSTGDPIWAKSIGSTYMDQAKSIHINSSGDVIVTGNFAYTVDFDPSENTTTLTSNGIQDGFLLKLSNSGDFIWVKKISYNDDDEISYAVSDVDGNIYVTGFAEFLVSFEPEFINDRCFLQKRDSAGNILWNRWVYNNGIGSSRGVELRLISDKLYLSGGFSGTIYLNTDSPVDSYSSNGGSNDIFIMKFDTSANQLWAKAMGGYYEDYLKDFEVDEAGDIYLTGEFGMTVDFDPGESEFILTSAGNRDIFILKLTALGEFSWVKRIGAIEGQNVTDISILENNQFLLTGAFTQTVDFDPGDGIEERTADFVDLYIASFTMPGEFQWVRTMGGPDYQQTYDCLLLNSGNMLLANSISGSADIDPGSEIHEITSLGYSDIVIEEIIISDVTELNEELDQSTEFEVYPNPALNSLSIEGLSGISLITIYDIKGTAVLKNQITNATIDISTLPQGIYMLKVETSSNTVQTKVFVKE